MTQVAETRDPAAAVKIGSIVLYGDCDPVLLSAVLFQMLDWQTTLVVAPEREAAVRRRLSAYIDGPGITIETAAADSTPDFVAVCTAEGALPAMGPGRAAAPLLALGGVEHDDGNGDVWSSCADIISFMRSSLGPVTRARDEMQTPYLAAGKLPSYFLALHAVFVATAALESEERPGRIDLTALECLLASLDLTIGNAQLGPTGPRPPQPAGQARRAVNGGRFFEASDGTVVMVGMMRPNPAMIRFLWKDEWADEDWWKEEKAGTPEQAQRFTDAVNEYCASRTRAEVVEAMQAVGVAASYVASAAEVFANPQLADHGFFGRNEAGEITVGRPVIVTTADKAALAAPSKQASSHGTKAQPLAGLTVCDLSWQWAGPFAAMCLAQLGATVIKVEGRQRIDHRRLRGPFIPGDAPQHERAVAHFATGRGKQSLTLNLKHPDGGRLVREVIAKSDVLLSNFQPGTMERLGLGFDEVSKIVGARPFVWAALSGYGATGPWKDYGSFGQNLADFGAQSSLTGTVDTVPIDMGVPFTDPLGGAFGAASILTALRRSRIIGAPIALDVSQFEVQEMAIIDSLRLGDPTGNWRPGDLAGTGMYRCADGDRWVAVSIRTPEVLSKLRALVGLPPSSEAPASDAAVDAAVAAWAAARDRDAAAKALRAAGIDATEMLTADEVMTDPSIVRSGFWYRTVPREGEVVFMHAPWRVDGVRTGRLDNAPYLGEHNLSVLRDFLGYTPEQVEALEPAGALD